MSTLKGTIEAVSCKEGRDHPKFGKSWQTSLKINDEWYGAFTKKDAASLGLEKGKLVQFNWTNNGEYKNFDPKSLEVSTTASAPSPQAESSSPAVRTTPRFNEAGIKVGHAVNNAVQLAISRGDISLKAIHGHAVDILTLSHKLEGQFELIMNAAAKAQVKPVVKAEAKPKGKAAKVVEDVGPEDEEGDPGATPDDEPADDARFDDEIPF